MMSSICVSAIQAYSRPWQPSCQESSANCCSSHYMETVIRMELFWIIFKWKDKLYHIGSLKNRVNYISPVMEHNSVIRLRRRKSTMFKVVSLHNYRHSNHTILRDPGSQYCPFTSFNVNITVLDKARNSFFFCSLAVFYEISHSVNSIILTCTYV